MPINVIYYALLFISATAIGCANLLAAAYSFWKGHTKLGILALCGIVFCGIVMMAAFLFGGFAIFSWMLHPMMPGGMPMNWTLP